MQTKIFEGNYNKDEFYSLMGKYFAESPYISEMPYLQNRKTNIWFVTILNDKVVGFGALSVLKNKVVLEHSYVEKIHRKKSIWKEINKLRFEYAEKLKLPLEVITKEPHLREHWIKNGFSMYRQNGSYFYLRKDIKI
jgi:hypothetical protein